MKLSGNIREIFRIPDAVPSPDLFLTKEEQAFLVSLGNADRSGSAWNADIADFYRRGLLDKELLPDGTEIFRAGCFYHFLSVQIVLNPDRIASLPDEVLIPLREWYFHQYYDWLVEAGAASGVLTDDRVLPLSEALSCLETTEQPVYLTDCECRLFYRNCGRERHVCLSLGCAPNSPGDRGYAKPISREEAMHIVREADQAGLMHTLSGMGICNCCGDCCCMFQSQKKLQSAGVWPVSEWIAEMDSSSCIRCGCCLGRCHLGVFQRAGRSEIIADPGQCAGCGLCVSTCPSGALRLVRRVSA